MQVRTRVMRGTILVSGLALGLAGLAAAPLSVGATGQPNQSCQAQPSSPGQASSSPGSPFNEPTSSSPGGTGGSHYSSGSQYDVACYQVSTNNGHS